MLIVVFALSMNVLFALTSVVDFSIRTFP
jgi:hypothetical protein